MTADALAYAAVTADALAMSCVGTNHLNGAVVESFDIVDSAVLTQHLAAGSVTGLALAEDLLSDTLDSIGRTADTTYVNFTESQPSLGVAAAPRIVATASSGWFVGSWTSGSDVKWKEVHGPMTDDALGALDAVDGYAWTWTGCGKAGSSGFGVTAQDFAKVCPAAVHHDATLGGLVVDYHAVAALNLRAAKALKAENDARVRDATGLHRRLEALEAALAALAAQPACALRHSACRCTCVWTPTGACPPMVPVPAPPTGACACTSACASTGACACTGTGGCAGSDARDAVSED